MSGTTHLDMLAQRVELLDTCVTQLQGKVADLERRYLDMQNDLSLVTSLQRSYLDLELRVNKLERPRPIPNSMPFTLVTGMGTLVITQ